MRHRFRFLGLKTPLRRKLTRDFFRTHGTFDGDALAAFVEAAMARPFREMHYAAIEMMEVRIKGQERVFVEVLDRAIGTQSWWDSVDWLAKLVGIHFERYPELKHPVTERWMAGGSMWHQRVAIIFQLRYRKKTDEALLFDYILRVADSDEFFLQKAAGWALRQYARTRPDAVRAFVVRHELPALTVREAMKHL